MKTDSTTRVFLILFAVLGLTACGGSGSGGGGYNNTGGGGGNGGGGGGYLVDFRNDAGVEEVGLVALSESDTSGGPLTNIVPGAHQLPSKGVPGALYSLAASPASGLGSKELGAYTSSQRKILAAAAGHYYTYLGFQAPAGRVIYLDTTSADGSTVGDYAIRSNSLDGTDDRLLISGCDPALPPPSADVIHPAGVLITCTIAGNTDVWASDGIAPAAHLPGTTGREAVDISATSAITFDNATHHLFTQPVNGAGAPAALSTDNGMADIYLGMSPSAQAGTSGQVVFVTQTGASSFRLWIQASTGHSAQTKVPYVCKGEPTLASNTSYSADGSKLLVLCSTDPAHGNLNTVHEFAFADSNTMDNVVTPNGVTSLGVFFNAWYLPDGKVLSRGSSGTDAYWVYIGATQGPGLASYRALYSGAIGSNVIFQSDGSLFAAPDDGSMVTLISNNLSISSATAKVLNGKIIYLDAANHPFLATVDASVNVQLDTQACNGVFFTGNGVGNREFFVTSHIAAGGLDTVSFDNDTGVVTPILTGATSDYGIYVP